MKQVVLCLFVFSTVACTHTAPTDTDQGTDSETETETETETGTAPCDNASDKLMEWMPDDWKAVEVEDEEWGHRDNGLYLGELPGHPNWGHHEVITFSFQKWKDTVSWSRLMEPYRLKSDAKPIDKPDFLKDYRYGGTFTQHNWNSFTFNFPDDAFSMTCRRAIVPTFPMQPRISSHMLCEDSEGRTVRFVHLPYDEGIPEACKFDNEPVPFPMRWTEVLRTVDDVTTIYPHYQEDGRLVADTRELWLHEDFTGGYSHVVLNRTWDWQSWRSHEEQAMHRETISETSWRFVREDGHTMDCERGPFTLEIGVSATMPFALHCVDSDGIKTEWNPHDLAYHFGFGVNEHPGGWWVVKEPI